jgi:hypothetical protein
MKIEEQCCSLELAKRLKELGVKQESIFCWQPITGDKSKLFPRKFDLNEFRNPSEDDRVAAFTVAELGLMLPYWFDSAKRQANDWVCRVMEINTEKNHYSFSEKEANARAKMLIHLIENNLIETKK